MGFFVILIILYSLYKKGVFDEVINNYKNQIDTNNQNTFKQNVSEPVFYSENNRLTSEQQRELKEKIKERNKKHLDPHYMPDKAKQFSSQEIDKYHDILDTCDTEGCEKSGIRSIFEEEVEEEGEYYLPLVGQLAIAEAIMNRKGF